MHALFRGTTRRSAAASLPAAANATEKVLTALGTTKLGQVGSELVSWQGQRLAAPATAAYQHVLGLMAFARALQPCMQHGIQAPWCFTMVSGLGMVQQTAIVGDH